MEQQVAIATTMEQIHVFVVAEVRLYREGLSASLLERANLRVVGTASSFDDAVLRTRAAQPHVVVLDVGMPRCLALIRAIRAESPTTRIVAFAINESDYEIVACAEAGVAGYVTVDSSIDELVATIKSVADGELRCSPKIAAVLMQRLTSLASSTHDVTAPLLTIREREIALLIEQGHSNKQIAATLCIELATVKNHVHNILDKLGVNTRGEVGARLRRAMPRRSLRPTPPFSFPATAL